MFKNITVLALVNDLPEKGQLDRACSAQKFKPTHLTQEISAGWLPPRKEDHAEFVEACHGHWFMLFSIETRSVPAAVIREKVNETCQKIMRNTGREPGRNERRALAEDVKQDLLPSAFPKRVSLPVWIDKKNSLLILGTTTLKHIDVVTTELSKTMSSVGMATIDTEKAPDASMAAWLQDFAPPAPLSIGDVVCELKSVDGDGVRGGTPTVRYSQHNLNMPQIKEHLRMGKRPTKLGLLWKDRVSFVLTSSLQLRNIGFKDVVFENSDDEEKSVFDTEMFITSNELSPLLQDILKAFGGMRPKQTAGEGSHE